ncbi:hypothetical protein HYV84_02420 [Candidatus Woesearchaeota archaeon]|nr:hypothetical protein [Candidatus Woesearchaeota archaeon]
MASLTLSVNADFKEGLKYFPWINWSEIAREESFKKLIFENYMKAGSITDEEWEFCEKIDWHPVDELPEKEEHRKEMEKRKKEPALRFKSVDEFFLKMKEKNRKE